jgi:uncharacterized protein involved in type VI secretion and phage assembly
MSGEFLQAQTAQQASGPDSGLSGVMVGRVIANCDQKHAGRVQVRLAVRGGIEIWARVATPDTGLYFIPQVDDEVVVAFHQGDGNEAFVIGRAWNDNRQPPRRADGDPVSKRAIVTPKELEVAFDDTELSIVIKTRSGRHVTLSQDGIEIGVDDDGQTAKISLDRQGNLTISARNEIKLKAQTITLEGITLNLGDANSASINIG